MVLILSIVVSDDQKKSNIRLDHRTPRAASLAKGIPAYTLLVDLRRQK
jgi:hypothetical protein